jgi:hypothetical protein
VRSAAGVKRKVHVHGTIPDAGQIQLDARRRAATTAGDRPEVWNRKGVAEPIGIGGYRGAAADHRSAALEFVDCEVHTFSEKHPKCIFHTVMLD